MSDKDGPLRSGSALEGALFQRFLQRLSEVREPRLGERIGAWRILRELGRGGSGVVFLAERADGAYSQEVALKWLRGDRPSLGARQALERERELLASLDHPNIARLIDGGRTDDGMLWFTMDYVDGERIDHHCRDLPVTDRVELIRDLCRAVHFAHGRGLIHGDIKPSNVMVDARGKTRLLDFGVARLKDSGDKGYGLTPGYASPEQRAGQPPTTASDIWQLGRLLESVLDDSGADRDLRAVIDQATSEPPEARYAAASELEADLTAWLKTRPVGARGGGFTYRFTRLVQRHKSASVLATAALLILVGSSIWFTWQLAEERDLAQSALKETEAALARAEDLREFLVDLFRAAEPYRPRDELPSTEELLALGARRALDEDAAAPTERLGMLLVLGEVYLALYQLEDAEPLIDAAVALGREHAEQQPLELARALELKGRLALHRLHYDEAREWLLEAEALAAGSDAGWNTYVSIREYRSHLASERLYSQRALEIIEPVYLEIRQGRQVQPRVHHRVLMRISQLYTIRNDVARALEVQNQAADLVERLEGKESLAHALVQQSRARLLMRQSQFDAAEDSLHEVLMLADRIAEHPNQARARGYLGLATLMYFTGRWEQALNLFSQGVKECAASRGLTADEHACGIYDLGRMKATMQRWGGAERYLQQARVQFVEMGPEFERWLNLNEIALAFVACHQDRIEEGDRLLAKVRARIRKEHPETPVRLSSFLTARAACRYGAGDHEQALEAIDRALKNRPPPGYVMLRSDQQILRARVLAELGRYSQAAESLDQAERQLEAVGLPEHPVIKRIHQTRQELF